MDQNRRNLLIAAGLAPALIWPLGAAWAEGQPACAQTATLTLAQQRQRRALGYADPSADPKKRCGLCAFFTGTTGGCGTCQLMSGGSVSGSAVCNSFAPKKA